MYTVLYHAMFAHGHHKKTLIGWAVADGKALLNTPQTNDPTNTGVYILAYSAPHKIVPVADNTFQRQAMQVIVDNAVESLHTKWKRDAETAEERVASMEHQRDILEACKTAVQLAVANEPQKFYTTWPSIEKKITSQYLESDDVIAYAKTTLAAIKRSHAGMKNYLTSKHAHLTQQIEGNEDLFDVNMHINMTLVHTYCDKTYTEKIHGLINLAAAMLVAHAKKDTLEMIKQHDPADPDSGGRQPKRLCDDDIDSTDFDAEGMPIKLMQNSKLLMLNAKTAAGRYFAHQSIEQKISENLNDIIKSSVCKHKEAMWPFLQFYHKQIPYAINVAGTACVIDVQAIGCSHQEYVDAQPMHEKSHFTCTRASEIFVHRAMCNTNNISATMIDQESEIAVVDPTAYNPSTNHSAAFVQHTIDADSNNSFVQAEAHPVIPINTSTNSNEHALFRNQENLKGHTSHCTHIADLDSNIENENLRDTQEYTLDQCTILPGGKPPDTGITCHPELYALQQSMLEPLDHIAKHCPLFASDKAHKDVKHEYIKLIPVNDDEGPADGCVDFDSGHGWHAGTSPSPVLDMFEAIQLFLHAKRKFTNQ